ncbi:MULTISPECIES: CueP family metal-binding protein [unclassified Corynebacterium]|uniref:CueP family metal-binding protein n=1 Tax=unclassified Corynebacterium TaxID=2624378 RepID=UPI002656BB87|nr:MULTISPECIES: CueP family metal-binding protein [unclassified Corynebacterium]MDN8594753.1 CueP family metal-binding protein [Corynebacterium sp. P4_F2]WKK56396.1 CueP family metal-binding protein [Corynebacterium sp. P4-C1]WKK56411.1 CueP family metal-binding protein [Corynebacterium sp. P4-C1]WKK63829.1 CueP family metal-binding protein [Corynebacterium sp. P8-C1]WKK63844.1 CueP family metal-binding protein [Corynebacterium sp. P8-C1]
MKRAAIAASALALTGCSAADPEPTADGTESQDTFLTTHGLAAMDAVEIIDHLDRQKVTERPTDLIASVRANELLLSSEDQEVVVDLPDNQTYVSIAPYLTSTHDCFYHSLTTCLGELDNEDIHVTITDEATGEVLVDEATTTFDNGFIGFWLPDDATGLIEVSYQGRTGTTEFSTTDDGATCVTNLHLT